ncbi:hypothetical protein Q7689_02150 [Nocardiopsis tropica]|uniref:hypothetical protein n=1 Tax=Nocardiopsis tropica TaxID=109330 RepID=UPI002E893B27|nr:hypothetical protein [Nocardiopsis tropica]
MTVYLSLITPVALLITFTIGFFYARHIRKVDLLLKLHQEMASTEHQQGRKILIDYARMGINAKNIAKDDRVAVNKALSMIDILGYYCKKKYVKESEILDLWETSLRKIAPKAQEFMGILDSEKGDTTWPYGRQLINKAESLPPARQIRRNR